MPKFTLLEMSKGLGIKIRLDLRRVPEFVDSINHPGGIITSGINRLVTRSKTEDTISSTCRHLCSI